MQKRSSLPIFFLVLLLAVGFFWVLQQKNQTELLKQKVLEEGKIILSSPQFASRILSPVNIRGKALTYDGVVYVRVADNNGKVIIEDSARTDATEPATYGEFAKKIYLPTTNKKNLVIEIFSMLPENDEEMDKVIVPFQLRDTTPISFYIFAPNKQLLSGDNGCSRVFPLERTMAATEEVLDTALHRLFDELSSEEIERGYYSPIASGVELVSFNAENPNVYIEVRTSILATFGNCKKESIRAQLVETLGQFPNISEVFVTFN